ncbi:MAG: GAF domain-containing protein [Deltaproteobacteria bacterium]|nr:MAG: GAF domain-containing protein [Deltaproteobacteria bacterium]
MNPSHTLRLRRVTSAFAVVWVLFAAAAGLEAKLRSHAEPLPPFTWVAFGGIALVAYAPPDSAASGVRIGDRLISIDGTDIDAWSRSRERGPLETTRTNRYLLEHRDGTRYAVALSPLARRGEQHAAALIGIATVLLGAVYFVIGFGVWWLKRDRAESWALLLFCCSMAALLFCGGPGTSSTVYTIDWLTTPFLGATTFHLFTTYPIEPAWIMHHRRARLLPYAAAGLLAALLLLREPLGLTFQSLNAVVTLFTIGLMTFCVIWLAYERRRPFQSDAARRADVMLLGALLSFAPMLLIVAAEYLFRFMVPIYFGLPFLLIFPCFVGYGILRRQLFDIRIVARSSLGYGVATLAITGLYALTVTFADAAFADFNVNARSPWFSVGFLFLAILALNPLRDRLQGLVDRVFDRHRVGYRQALREISDAMVSMLSLREIGDRILAALTETMGVEHAVVLLLDEPERRLSPEASRGDWEEGVLQQPISIDHPVVRSLWLRREELERADFDEEPDPEIREACRDVFDTLEVELLVPILFGVDLLGAIAVGRKFSGERIDADDRQLLRTLANQSAIAIENAKSYDEIAQLNETLEARVEARTRELRDTQAQLVQNEKMVSLGHLVAGVAHELNNPIGFIHANLQLIDENIRKLTESDPQQRGRSERAREALVKLLARSREGTERVKRIVEDMRTFSRLDEAELQEVDLHEGIDRTLSLMTPRLKHGITVERDYGELPPVRCFAGQLNQVFMNVLMNACDALEGSGTIRITTRATPDGVWLAFQDDGPGIPARIRNRVFEPFFTTKAVGQGTGLGLSISHGIVERHGGTIRVDSEPGEGATFIIELPLDAQRENP